MKTIIMRRATLDGFLLGDRPSVDHLFMKNVTDGCNQKTEWIPQMFDATSFSDVLMATNFARQVWGYEFTGKELMFVSVDDRALDASRKQHIDHIAYQESIK